MDLSGLIKDCERRRGLTVTEENSQAYSDFIMRYLSSHPTFDVDLKLTDNLGTYDYPYRNLLFDAMYLFGCLINEQEVMDVSSRKVRLDDDNNLPLLSHKGPGPESWPDRNIYRLYDRRGSAISKNRRRKKPLSGLMPYGKLLIELCNDPHVARVRGRHLDYYADISTKWKRNRMKISA
ncbi:MAG: hypothetical protein KJ709_02185 [Nanoarchaeota archaeon]|nr:hypothetical protein [Nanoarchaeota archaeon]